MIARKLSLRISSSSRHHKCWQTYTKQLDCIKCEHRNAILNFLPQLWEIRVNRAVISPPFEGTFSETFTRTGAVWCYLIRTFTIITWHHYWNRDRVSSLSSRLLSWISVIIALIRSLYTRYTATASINVYLCTHTNVHRQMYKDNVMC